MAELSAKKNTLISVYPLVGLSLGTTMLTLMDIISFSRGLKMVMAGLTIGMLIRKNVFVF